MVQLRDVMRAMSVSVASLERRVGSCRSQVSFLGYGLRCTVYSL